jgi:hypothetical protein
VPIKEEARSLDHHSGPAIATHGVDSDGGVAGSAHCECELSTTSGMRRLLVVVLVDHRLSNDLLATVETIGCYLMAAMHLTGGGVC